MATPLCLAPNHMILFSTLTKTSNQKRLSNNFSDEKVFQESAIYYEVTLNKTAYIDKLVYHALSTSNQENKNKHCQR